MLDVLRGLAILGIFFLNVPTMGASVWADAVSPKLIGWSPADQAVWTGLDLFVEGTQRALLEFLFGAGAAIVAARWNGRGEGDALRRFWRRRNLWLFAFGLADVALLLWPGDILHTYALAALLLLPFVRAPARLLVPLGLLYAGWTLANDGAALMQRAAHPPSASATRAALAARIAPERIARTGSVADWARWNWGLWLSFLADGTLAWNVFEAWCAMLLGVALWRLGILGGARAPPVYTRLALVAYALGITVRIVWLPAEAAGSDAPQPLYEAARLLVALGHLALVNRLMLTRLGARALAPWGRAGRVAFSLYLLQQVAGLLIFSPLGLGWWGRFGWAGLAAIAVAVTAVELVLAQLWLRRFATGPVEWLWRTLSYGRRPPFALPREAPRG